ncbi:MAG: type I glyceraldehyde-3-phosphate dehydrogenase [Bacilli bacterium]|nr:type I glyceraldehyde-3-phosphate dehydrogenase [Bacilli bacterium]MDD4282579.1 type I glyceraldehyde-3-phosphate dehydrogenase [Bacilli bacterium]MDD4718800.1 type I glyceraldehyde-3-phosphate dehydrogenase [Bacilli bacterium]
MKKVAINGFGRIGRLIYRLLQDDLEFEVVAINDLTDAEQLAYLLKYDTSHRSYMVNEISYEDEYIIVKGKKIKVFAEKDPSDLPWGELGIDMVFECTGIFTSKDKSMAHINAGAKTVVISAPAKGDLKTIVYGVNENILDGSDEIISAASCTTNCLAPVIDVLDKNFGLKKGYMTTIHAYTNDQTVLDVPHKKGANSRRGRAAAANIIPSSTGAASAIGLVLPHLKGKLDGTALRVPTTTGSIIDLSLQFNKSVTVEEINKVFLKNQSEVIMITMDPVVSSDIISSHLGALVDGQLINVLEVDGEQMVKVMAWYDNEMGYSAQMVRTAKHLANLK